MPPKADAITLTFLVNASLFYKDVCPEQSRFLMRRHQMNAASLPESVLCPFCFQWRQPDNHRVRLRPKRKPTARIRRLLRRDAAGKRLNIAQAEILQKFKRATNALMVTCHTCSKTSRKPGMNREFLTTQSRYCSTPGSVGKFRTPQSANRATPKSSLDRTPSGRRRSVTSNTNSSSSKSGSAKSSPFARLKKLLMLEDKQQSKKGGLKDFLSSL
ncbi:UPF0711 protein C18orf21 homolog isoform X1 [Myxocyprinus asiaticus]|uniref:UPF0711 protein C18orf21 homolog isoform X1 n=2 Tax=Myxocyprinus asiaticus TaxID=70543 RepID=UPI0022236DF0|nr:UPF0711 protein C18orf21 homolog isoform X1 [Myxocyprinus asiaticus]